MAAEGGARGFAAWFHDLSRWDPAGFRHTKWLWPAAVLRPVGSVLLRVVDEVGAETGKADLPIIGKISFGGEISLLEQSDRSSYKGKLFWARKGQLTYSKIRVKQGSFCVIPAAVPAVAVSAEYPVYEIDRRRMLPKFLDLLVRSAYVKSVLDGLARGGSTKTRISPEQFETLQIPVPPLEKQQAIVALWEQAQAATRQAQEQAEAREAQAQADFLAALGLSAPVRKQHKQRALALRWSAMERWGVESSRLAQGAAFSSQTRFPIAEGNECIASVSHGCSVSPSAQPTALHVLKISAVTKGWLDLSERKFAPDVQRLRETFSLQRGDVLMCRTNGTLAYVGAAALVDDDLANTIFPDKVIRVRLKDNVLPAFFWQVLKTPLLRSQIESFARTAVGNYAIGGKDIWKLRLPLPPLDIQRSLVAALGQGHAEAARWREQAAHVREQARLSVERALLGAHDGAPGSAAGRA